MTEQLLAREVAARVKVTTKTLYRWRMEGSGPPFVDIGGANKPAYRYPLDGLEGWLAEKAGRRERRS